MCISRKGFLPTVPIVFVAVQVVKVIQAVGIATRELRVLRETHLLELRKRGIGLSFHPGQNGLKLMLVSGLKLFYLSFVALLELET